MLARVIRSGLVEAFHEGAVAASLADGTLVAAAGNVARPFYFRSAAKPFQATVAQELGAALSLEQLAISCASHGGQPVHEALVRSMLAEFDLDEGALRCPPAWPRTPAAGRRLAAAGHRRPRPMWHNCSGKHAAMLRACRAQGWPIEDYDDPGHPLQRAVTSTMGDVTGEDPTPVGRDGCGLPVFRVSTVGVARAFARLATDDRFREAWNAMHRFPTLVSDAGEPDAAIATWIDAAAKQGAEGCMGVAVRDRMGVAVKCWDGAMRGAAVGMVEALRQLGLLVGATDGYLDSVAMPEVRGGESIVGAVEPALELK